jgi:hypothetical protein
MIPKNGQAYFVAENIFSYNQLETVMCVSLTMI